MRRALFAFVPAVFGAYLLGSLLATQVILARLQAMGMPVTLREHLRASWHDVLGQSGSYLPLMCMAFALALPVAAGLSRLLPRLRLLFFVFAGALAVVTIHVAMKQLLGHSDISATRDLHGLLLQGVAGWFGGYLFYVFMGWAHP